MIIPKYNVPVTTRAWNTAQRSLLNSIKKFEHWSSKIETWLRALGPRETNPRALHGIVVLVRRTFPKCFLPGCQPRNGWWMSAGDVPRFTHPKFCRDQKFNFSTTHFGSLLVSGCCIPLVFGNMTQPLKSPLSNETDTNWCRCLPSDVDKTML